MTTNATLIENLTAEQLSENFRAIVREELSALQPKEAIPTYLSREEVCKSLKISLPTLNVYTKKGIIRGSKVGTRVLYLASDVQDALVDATLMKFRRNRS